jgi:hypothetical protein
MTLYALNTRMNMNLLPEVQDLFAAKGGVGEWLRAVQDPSADEIPMGTPTSCLDEKIAAQYPARCVGSSVLVPEIQKNLSAVFGAPILDEASALSGYLLCAGYLAIRFEAWACSQGLGSACDGSWAFYNVASPRRTWAGFAGFTTEFPGGQTTDDRIFDGLLALQCWRDVDRAVPPARSDLLGAAMRQLDFGLQHALAANVHIDLTASACQNSQSEGLPLSTALNAMAMCLVPAAKERDAALGRQLEQMLSAASTSGVDPVALGNLLDALFPCP